MLKRLFILICFALIPLASIKAQYNVIRFDLVGVMPAIEGGVARIGYERTFGPKFSAGITLETGTYVKGLRQLGQVNELIYSVKGWGIMPEVRYYPISKKLYAPEGLFVGASYRYRVLEEKYTDNVSVASDGTAHNASLFIGYKYVYNNFGFETLLGFGSATGAYNTPNDRSLISDEFRKELNANHNAVRLEISVSYVFPKVKRRSDVVLAPPYLSTHANSTDVDSANMVIVYLYRPDKVKGQFLSYPIFHNNKLIANARNGFYKEYVVQGEQEIEFNMLTRSAHGVTFKALPGNTYFIECNIKRGPLGGTKPVMRIVSPDEALPIIKALIERQQQGEFPRQ